MLEVTTALIVVSLCLWYLYRRRKFSVFERLGIPGPKPNILFGNLWELSTRTPMVCHKEWIEKYGDIVGYFFGANPIILVTDLEILKKVQISEFQKFINRPGIFVTRKQKPGDGLTAQLTVMRDRRWKEVRSALTPSFTTSKMKQMAPIINNAIDTLITNIDKKAKDGTSFDIFLLYKGLTMDVIGRTAFGIQTDCQNNPNDPFLRSAKSILSGSIASYLALVAFSFPELSFIINILSRLRLRYINRGLNPFKELVSGTKEMIKARKQITTKKRHDLMQIMIDAHVSESDVNKSSALTAGEEDSKETTSAQTNVAETPGKTSIRLDDNEIVDNAVLFLLAGYETTSTALAFTTHFLLYHPEVQEKVRTEVLNLIQKEGKLDYTSVQQLQYLDQVLTESMRMYPPITLFVNREASEDVTIGSYDVSKGSTIQVPVYTLQHDERYWEDPETFDPERFSPENKSRNKPLAYQAFGAGPRNCVGMRLAQMEAKLALARILSRYRFEKCDTTDDLKLTLKISAATITPGRGINLKVVPL